MLPSKQFETPMNIKITIVKTFCGFGHNFFKKTAIVAISYEKNLETLVAGLMFGLLRSEIPSGMCA